MIKSHADKLDDHLSRINRLEEKQSQNDSAEDFYSEINDREIRKDNSMIYQLVEPDAGIRRGLDRKKKDIEKLTELLTKIDVPINYDDDIKFI